MAEAVSLTAILGDDDILLDAPAASKAALLAAAAEHIGRTTGLASEVVLKALTSRETLGSTAINNGIAVPHAGVGDLRTPAGAFFRLAQPIEFEASDSNPVDLVFVVVWPSDKRSGLLATLGELCRTLREETLRQELREASSRAEVRQILDEAASPNNATSL